MRTLHVAVDESTNSLRSIALGELLNRQLDGRLVLTSVATQVDKRREALWQRLGEEGLERYRDGLRVEQGDDAAQVLAQLAANPDEALLCMTSHSRRPVSELFLGSVAAAVVQHSNALVVLGGPRFNPLVQERVETLMVCVDGSKLAEAVLPRAVSMAKELGAGLQLLHVVGTEAVKASALPQGIRATEPSDPGGHADIMESGYIHALACRIKEEYDFDADWEVLHGYEPAESIVSYLADQPNVMAVMTTHGRSGLSQLAAGSVSHEVLHEARCPVAVMRPAAPQDSANISWIRLRSH
ncbi:hypothetical protein GCM10007160_25730 [Litchfieldella qijiaojingensis]|uniref:UspA domain-containing protein n=1 Tax=Litchfieldella qijiaojingensis TaxID=980347 RepID=A0ABQ2YVW0_9GAMM|nr:universal stress protein [Halomonas qijiaojingensis]GGX97092.1 hypothetical protein GCM10007160_25730 [Halomonas qijiaojingensis]